MEELETKVTSLTSENSALKTEVAQLQNIIKQMNARQQQQQLSRPSRNAQAGICLLIVLFSLGLFVNVAGGNGGNSIARVRRDNTQLISFVNSPGNSVPNTPSPRGWDRSDDSDSSDEEVKKTFKRMAPDDEKEGERGERATKRTRNEQLEIISDSHQGERQEEREDDTMEVLPEETNGIAVIFPGSPPSLTQDYRVLNIHVWPLTR